MIREFLPVKGNSSKRGRWAACQCAHVGDVDRPEQTPTATVGGEAEE